LHHALDFIHDCFQFGSGHGPFFARFQKSLQNLLPLEALAAPVLLDDHVGNFVDALVGRESAATFQALAPAANGVAGAALRESITLSSICAQKGHFTGVILLAGRTFARCFFFVLGHLAQFPSENPSWMSNGTPTKLDAANVISHITMAAAAAGSFSTPKIVV